MLPATYSNYQINDRLFIGLLAAAYVNLIYVALGEHLLRRQVEHEEALGVDGGRLRGLQERDVLQRAEERVDVGHPVLEQVADPARPVGEQLVGVLRRHPHHQAALAAHADRHVAVEQERQAAEHRLLVEAALDLAFRTALDLNEGGLQ